MNIIPLCSFELSILVGLEIDFAEPTVDDGLVVDQRINRFSNLGPGKAQKQKHVTIIEF
jgi:hypothetical protein